MPERDVEHLSSRLVDGREAVATAAAQGALRAARRRLWAAPLPGDSDRRADCAQPAKAAAPNHRDRPTRGTRGGASAGVAQLAAQLRSGQTTAAALATEALADATAAQQRLGAFTSVTDELALTAAREADRELAAGHDRGLLHGIPVAVKDIIDVRGVRTTNGTSGLGWRVAQHDAPAWAALRRAGAVLVGKTATYPLAWGATTPGCRNPVDPARSPGGSSGGSAAAVAAGVVAVALGTDTGGSIRLPAALCGVVGFRPASGTVPMAGITPLAPSQDVVGPITGNVADCMATAAVLAGREWAPQDARVKRIGLIDEAWTQRLDPGVSAAFTAASDLLADAGIEPVAIRVPLAELAPAASYLTMLAESADLWWSAADAEPDAITGPVRALLRVGAGVAPADRQRARAAANAIRRSLCEAMADADVEVCALATTPVTARPIDATSADIRGRSVDIGAAYVALTALASVTGLAALSVPCGVDDEQLPVGFQLIAAPGREPALWFLGGLLETGEPRA